MCLYQASPIATWAKLDSTHLHRFREITEHLRVHQMTIKEKIVANWDDVDLLDKDEHIEQASRAMKAMSHPLRLKILCVLGDKEVSVQDIVDQVGTSQSNISQHLAILRDKGVLRTRKDANRVYYRVGDTRTLKLLGLMRDVFCSFA